MAAVLDFSGSMRLAESLSAFEEPLASGSRPPTSPLAARVHREIETVRARVDRAFADPFRPRNSLADATTAWTILSDAEAWGGDAKAISRAARDLWDPIATLVSGRIEFVRASLFDIREEIAPELRAAGPRAGRLETLDRVVHAAMREPVDKLFARILPLMETRFGEDLALALALIGSEISGDRKPDDLAGWYQGDGLLARHVRQGRDVVLGVLEFEADRLMALAEACCGAVDD
jgi:hypothetical protein